MQQKVFSDWFLALPLVIDIFARFKSARLWNAPLKCTEAGMVVNAYSVSSYVVSYVFFFFFSVCYFGRKLYILSLCLELIQATRTRIGCSLTLSTLGKLFIRRLIGMYFLFFPRKQFFFFFFLGGGGGGGGGRYFFFISCNFIYFLNETICMKCQYPNFIPTTSHRNTTLKQRRLNVDSSTLNRRCFNFVCPLGLLLTFAL